MSKCTVVLTGVNIRAAIYLFVWETVRGTSNVYELGRKASNMLVNQFCTTHLMQEKTGKYNLIGTIKTFTSTTSPLFTKTFRIRHYLRKRSFI